MYRVCVTSEEKQKILAAQAEQIRENYETLIENNLIVEKKLREQKYIAIQIKFRSQAINENLY